MSHNEQKRPRFVWGDDEVEIDDWWPPQKQRQITRNYLAMTDPESTSLLRQAEAMAEAEGNRLDATVTTDGQRVDGEVSASHAGESWWMRAWARVTARKGAKPDTSAGVQFGARWFGGWDR